MSTADFLAGLNTRTDWVVWAVYGGLVVLALACLLLWVRRDFAERGWRRAALGLAVLLGLAGGTSSVVGMNQRFNDTDHAERTIAQYVHDHDQLVALSPVEWGSFVLGSCSHDACFDAIDASGAKVHVVMDWAAVEAAPVDPSQVNTLAPTVTITR